MFLWVYMFLMCDFDFALQKPFKVGKISFWKEVSIFLFSVQDLQLEYIPAKNFALFFHFFIHVN